MIAELKNIFTSNLVSIEEYLSGVSAHSRRNETVSNVLTHVAGAAQSRLSYLLCLQGYRCHCRGAMSKSGIVHMFLYSWYCRQFIIRCLVTVVLQSQTLTRLWLPETIVMECHCGQNVKAEIIARSLVSSLQSSFVHLNPSSHNLSELVPFPYSRFAYSLFAYLLLLGAILPTHATCQEKSRFIG